jgi:hypothetical protein
LEIKTWIGFLLSGIEEKSLAKFGIALESCGEILFIFYPFPYSWDAFVITPLA